MDYKKIYEMCLEKAADLNIDLDEYKKQHIQDAKDLKDVYKNFVFHSQNKSQNYAIHFFNEMEKNNVGLVNEIWECISNYKFNFEDQFSYMGLFKNFIKIKNIKTNLCLWKKKDIQYLELAKTCQGISNYLNRYKDLESFIQDHKFSNNFKANWKIFKKVSNQIYNVGTALVPDFFKEQKYIEGREFIIKPDTHVKRFFEILCNEKSLTDKQVFDKMMEMYEACNSPNKKEKMSPYNLDKLIYLIGVKYKKKVKEFKEFAVSVRDYAK